MKFFVVLVMGAALTVLTALLFTAFTWAGWNYGVVPALDFAQPVTLVQAFFLSLAIGTVSGAFKTSLTYAAKD